MLRDAWKVIGKFILVAGVFLSFLILIELFRVFLFFYQRSHALGWGFVGVCIVLVVGSLVYLRTVLAAYPRVLAPPRLPPLNEAGYHDLKAFCQYLRRYLRRLSLHPNLSDEQRVAARLQAERIESELSAHPLLDDLRRLIQETEDRALRPCLSALESMAAKEVRHSVRDVMLGVSLSPYHTVDLLVVLYRNAAMVVRIAGIYASRPNTREQWLILGDVLKVVVTVNFLYIGRNLIENLFAHLPLIGRAVDDIGQGLGAGLFTSAAGHAAIERCAAYRGWDKRSASESLAAQTKAFLVDVRDIFTRDVFPDIRGRIRVESPPERVEQPDFWEKVSRGIAASIDATAAMVGTLVVKPAVAGAQTLAKAGDSVTRVVTGGGNSSSPRHLRRRHRRRQSSASSPIRVLKTFGQRLRYTFLGPRP